MATVSTAYANVSGAIERKDVAYIGSRMEQCAAFRNERVSRSKGAYEWGLVLWTLGQRRLSGDTTVSRAIGA